MSPTCFDEQIYAPYLKSMLMTTKRSQPSTRDHFRMHRQRLLMHAARFVRATKARACDSSWRAANKKTSPFPNAHSARKQQPNSTIECWMNPAAAERGSAFVPVSTHDLHRVFSLQFERTVNRDNTVRLQNLTLQIEAVTWRGKLA